MNIRVHFPIDMVLLFPVLFLCLFLNGQSDVDSILPQKGICAHRDAMKTHPENTITAFKEAIRLGAQMIEFDVRLTIDNELIIMHDETVDRTTDGFGHVNELTLSEIRELDAGSWKSQEFTGEKVPTLKETLQIMPRNIWLNIHLKGNKKLGIETAKLVLSENRMHQSILACEKQSAKGVRTVEPKLMICNMERLSSRSEYISSTQKMGYPFIQLKKSRNSESIKGDIQNLKNKNIRINYVKSDEVKEVGELLELGIDFIFTDDLAPIIEAFQRYRAIGDK